ncbi:hypothetical protein DPMN_047065 [Dreissena polymorpha]|uniref:Uncharacterized protein n=1 Tax=Dreissena polymorpha TaxID=45954 RepID=A0A9D4D960_DREPO|nr:hypothetical protein DPMN_047065 [Dreissena polymorpha]
MASCGTYKKNRGNPRELNQHPRRREDKTAAQRKYGHPEREVNPERVCVENERSLAKGK